MFCLNYSTTEAQRTQRWHREKLKLGHYQLFRGLAEENVDPIKRDRAAADHRTGCNCAPEDVGSRELPNGEQRSKHRHQDASAGDPEGNTSDETGI